MYISKLISFFVFVLFFTGNVFSQEKNIDSSQLLLLTTQHKNTVDLDSLHHCIDERENLINKVTKDKDKVPLLMANNAGKDTIIAILSDLNKEKSKIITEKDAELKNFRFFKIKDISIFNSNEQLAVSEVPLCLQKHYKLILDIRELDKLLYDIEQKITKIESEEYVKNLSNNSKQEILKSAIKEYLDTADSLIGQIDEKDKSGLYPEQAEYYRPFLVNKFNNFLDKIYPQ